MKTKKALTIMAASAMMLSLMGCGSSAETAPSAGEIPTMESSLSVESENTQNETESVIDASTDTAEALADSSIASANLSDDSINVNGKVISVLDDAQKTIDALGNPDRTNEGSDEDEPDFIEKKYSYDLVGVELSTFVMDGKESLLGIYVTDPSITTSKGIKVGSTKDEVIEAYGTPTKETDDDIVKFVEYKLDTYNISFNLTEKGTVERFYIENQATHDMVSWS